MPANDSPSPAAPPAEETAFPLLDAYLQELHAGRQPDREKLLAEHPELADMLRCLEALDQLAPSRTNPLPPADSAKGEKGDATLSSKVASPFSPGGITDFGKFELLHEVGRGGMGVIWKARQKDLDRVVAVKMILANQLASREQIDRFVAEAKTMARLHHPHIVRIHETGQQAGQHYFVMEFIAGCSLAERLRAHGPLPPDQAARALLPVARAVAYLHEQGIVHRDLKPSNILLDEQGQPYVTDFGLVKMLGTASGATATGAVLGTPAYMAPEQAAGRLDQVGPLSDVYSLGAILYELLTGRPPFQEENPLETLVQVIEGEPTRPRGLDPAIPPALELVCLKCLEKVPEKRYPSAAAVADDLERYLNGDAVEARPRGPWALLSRWARREPALVSRLGALIICTGIAQANYLLLHNVSLRLHVEIIGLLAIWLVASVLFQRMLHSERWAFGVPFAWTLLEVALLTAILVLTDSQITPLLVAYPLLIAASGLWFRVYLVWFTTAAAEAGYLVLLYTFYRDKENYWPDPHHHAIFLVGLAVLGFVMAYQVQRIRALSRYYEHRPLP